MLSNRRNKLFFLYATGTETGNRRGNIMQEKSHFTEVKGSKNEAE